jgi:hypothetical protein
LVSDKNARFTWDGKRLNGEAAAADANSDLRRITLARKTNLKHVTTNQ